MTTTDGESDAWPTEALVPTGKPYTDGRGTIHNLIEVSTGSTVLIDSKAGSVRANHFHKTDWHYCYLISGSMDYYHRAAGAPEPRVTLTAPVLRGALDTHVLIMGEDKKTAIEKAAKLTPKEAPVACLLDGANIHYAA